MNASRDIEKLFDNFGGNPAEYQEIGRENEARSARTRWPLLATLDFSQPPIPAVAQQSEARDKMRAPAATRLEMNDRTPGATPIKRSDAPLFARPHRRAVPPVGNVILPEVPRGGARFAELPTAGQTFESAEISGNVPAPAMAPQVAAASQAAPTPPAAFTAAFTAAPSAPLPRPVLPVAAPIGGKSNSILGKLFAAPAAVSELASAPGPQQAPSLQSVFERLRAPAAAAPASAAAPLVRSNLAGRLPRS